MTRPIKFRVWNNLTKEWKNPYDYTYGDLFGDDKYITQQFTGLLDKNGREIYEGDIVKSFDENHEVFADLCSMYLKFSDGRIGCRIDNMNPKNLTVIGNIFENKELLNEHIHK